LKFFHFIYFKQQEMCIYIIQLNQT